jgi:hypothetical protein
MDWSNEPATWKQVQSLKRFGCKPDHPLTKIEAAALLSRYGVVSETPLTTSDDHLRDAREPESQRLRVALENARRDLTQAKPGDIDKLKENIARVTAERQRFWVDTCRDLGRTLIASEQAHELYQKYGCRFVEPTLQDVLYILEALDSAAPNWDRDHPELFFQTLELNYPRLLRRC